VLDASLGLKKVPLGSKEGINSRGGEAYKYILGNEKRQISEGGVIVCKGENELVR